jgi:hypothetical protein
MMHIHQNNHSEFLYPMKKTNMQPPEDDIFDEINNRYIDENLNWGAEGGERDPGFNIATVADAELTLYKQEPTIKLKKDDGTFNCPLTWWKYNEQKYKLLSI